MSKIRININNKINLSYPPSNLSKEVKRALSFPNPAYDDAISFGRTTRGIPKKIRLYEELNGVLSIPRGSWDVLSRILNDLHLEIDVTNNTTSLEKTQTPKSIKLWEYQEPWVANMLRTSQGVGIAPPGAGKTLMALKIYETLGQPCLWVTHTQRLATQVARRAEQFLGIETGLIGNGKEDIKHFTVGLVPTLVRRDLSQYKDTFGTILIDECFPAGTLVDGRPIESIKVGDTVTSFNEVTGKLDKNKVVRLFKNRAKSLVRVVVSPGKTIICTPGHPFWTKKDGWKQAISLTPNDEVLDYGQDTGLLSGLPTMRRKDRKKNNSPKERRRSILSWLQKQASNREGCQTRTTLQRVWKDNYIFGQDRAEQGTRRKNLLLEKLCSDVQESCFVKNNGRYEQKIRQRSDEEEQPYAQQNQPRQNVSYSSPYRAPSSLDRWEGKGSNRATNVSLVGSLGRLYTWVANRIPGANKRCPRAPELYLSRYRKRRPTISHRDRRWLPWTQENARCRPKERGVPKWVGVESVEVLEPGGDGKFGGLCSDGYVYNIEVENDHTYLVDGVVVHNCHHVPASTFLKVISEFSARNRYGVTATPYREDQLEKLIFSCVGPQLSVLDKDDLRALGKLMTPKIVRRHTDYYFPYNPSSRKHNYHALVDDISNDFKRNQQIATDVIVESTINDNNVCIVLVGRIQHGEELLAMIDPVLPNTGFVHSKMKLKERDAILDDFESGKFRVLIATYKMLAEGFDYQPSNRLFLTAPFKGRSLIEQACGRIERAFPGKESAVVFDYVDIRVGVLTRQAETRLDVYEMNNNPVITLSS